MDVSGRSLEWCSNAPPRGMAVLDRIRLTGLSVTGGPGFRTGPRGLLICCRLPASSESLPSAFCLLPYSVRQLLRRPCRQTARHVVEHEHGVQRFGQKLEEV